MLKRCLGALLLVAMLTGCGLLAGDESLDRADAFRKQAGSSGGSFRADIVADLGEVQFSFSMDCQFDAEGTMTFAVTAPETIADITGTMDGADGQLTFDGAALDFGQMAGGRVTPVTGPYVLLTCWREGYCTACGQEERGLRLTMPAGYESQALLTDTWLDPENGIPIYAELCYNNQRILSITISDFTFDNAGE